MNILSLTCLLTSAAMVARADVVNFDTINDAFLFDFVNQNATAGFDETGGIGDPASGAFRWQSTYPAGYEKRVLAIHKTAIDFSRVKKATMSIYLKGDELINAPIGKKGKANVRFGFLADSSFANLPINTDSGVNFGQPKMQDIWKVNGGFVGDAKIEYDNKSSGATTKMSIEVKGHASGGTENKVEKIERSTYDPDTWYQFEITLSRGLTTSATFDMSYKMIDAGMDGTENTLLQSSSIVNAPNLLMNTDTTVYPALMLEGEKNTEPNTLSFPIDHFTWEIEYLSEAPIVTKVERVNDGAGVLLSVDKTVTGQNYNVEFSETMAHNSWSVIGTINGGQTTWGYNFFGSAPVKGFFRLRYIKQ